jgi:hypothetical protein
MFSKTYSFSLGNCCEFLSHCCHHCSENSVWLGSPVFYFKLQVIYKSYKQVLTLIASSLLLLKQGILDKFRLVTSHKIQHKEVQCFNWFVLGRRNGNSADLEPQSINVTTLVA